MGRPRKETATTNAERCKKYREKNREAYRANDALRKQLARQRMKQNPHQRQLILKREAAAKREQRLRNKLFEQNGNIYICLLYTSPSPRDQRGSRMPSSA